MEAKIIFAEPMLVDQGKRRLNEGLL